MVNVKPCFYFADSENIVIYPLYTYRLTLGYLKSTKKISKIVVFYLKLIFCLNASEMVENEPQGVKQVHSERFARRFSRVLIEEEHQGGWS